MGFPRHMYTYDAGTAVGAKAKTPTSASRILPAVSFPPPATEAPLLPLSLTHPPQSDPMAPFNHYYHQAESSVEARAAIR